MAGAIKAIIASQFDDTGLKKAQKSLGSLGASMKGALGAIGITASLGAIVKGYGDAAKAAVEDGKSQALLANQLRNTTGASDAQIASVEKAIRTMQFQASVADDVIRPAFASLVRATGDVGKATDLTSLALDVAAGTGKDLSAVALALGKAVNGSSTSLIKLVPSIKGATNPLKELEQQFAGAAQTAGNADPFQRFSIVMQDLQETVGVALLPTLQDMATWFSDEKNMTNLTNFAKLLGDIGTGALNAASGVDSFIKSSTILSTALNFGAIGDLLSGNFEALKQGGLDLNSQLLKSIGRSDLDPQRYKNLGAAQKELYYAMQKSAPAIRTTSEYIQKYSTVQSQATKTTKANTDALKASKAAQEANSKARIKYWEDLVKTRELLKKQAEAEAELQTQLIETRKELQASTAGFSELFKAQADIGEFETRVVDSFGNIKETISSALADGKITASAASSLNLLATSTESSLKAIGKQLDDLTAKRKAAQNLYDDVKGSILGAGNLTGLLETESKSVTKTVTSIINGLQVAVTSTTEEVTSGGLLKNFKKVLDKTKAFAEQLKTLRKLGLDQNLFKQIVDAGAEAGGAIASEIIAGGADSVKEINTVYKDLADVSGQIAEQTAVVFFNDGKDVVGGLVNGLLAQEQQLVDAATTLANAFLSTFNSLIANLKVPTTTTTVGAASMNLYDVAKSLAPSTQDYFSTSEYINQARIAQRNNAPIQVVVNAGVGTNGKAVGAAIQAELNKYASANA
jgi:hypothetical protein